jgi:phage/plasmid-like protein (TIGR03299 family)
MPAGIVGRDSMLSYREVPWHGLGTVLQKRPKTIEEVLKIAKLDWTVTKEPIFIRPTQKQYLEVPGHFAITRDVDHRVLGTVTDRYEPRQNRECFAFLESLLGELIVETAGSLWDGRIVWMMVKFPDHITVGGDQVAKFCYIRTQHDGLGATTVRNTPVRVVCANTDNIAMRASTAVYALRHLPNLSGQLSEARQVLKLSVDYFKQFEKVGQRFASAKVSERKLAEIMGHLYPMEEGMGDRAVKNREEAYATVLGIFRGDEPYGKTVGNAPGSAWCAFNAVTEWRDHYNDTNGAEGQFRRMMDDPAQYKQRAFEVIAEAVKVTV